MVKDDHQASVRLAERYFGEQKAQEIFESLADVPVMERGRRKNVQRKA